MFWKIGLISTLTLQIRLIVTVDLKSSGGDEEISKQRTPVIDGVIADKP